jgi:antitoxin component of MazEF toxin-antitoxin module
MTVAVKNHAPLVVPEAALRRAGFKRGQELELKISGGLIEIVPKLPSGNEEYTPKQRRAIDAQLRAAEKGPFHGPFDSVDDMIVDMKVRLTKPKAAKKAKPSR